jgi:hypothetical protein
VQVNEAMAARLFSGQLQLTMHMAQKLGSGGGGAKPRAARTKKAAAASADAAGPSGGAAAATAALVPDLQQQQQQQRRQQQQQRLEDPIVDLCDDEDDDGKGEEEVQLTHLIGIALKQLNAEIKRRDANPAARGPLNTHVQSKVGAGWMLCLPHNALCGAGCMEAGCLVAA